MTNRNAAETHRRLERGQAEAMARDGDGLVEHVGALVRPRDRRKDMRTMTNGRPPREPRVLLMQLSERTSGSGTRYFSGWLGKARLVAFLGDEPDPHGNPVWNVYAAEPQPRGDRPANRPGDGRGHG